MEHICCLSYGYHLILRLLSFLPSAIGPTCVHYCSVVSWGQGATGPCEPWFPHGDFGSHGFCFCSHSSYKSSVRLTPLSESSTCSEHLLAPLCLRENYLSSTSSLSPTAPGLLSVWSLFLGLVVPPELQLGRLGFFFLKKKN